MSKVTTQSIDFFKEEGHLSEAITHFQPRFEQQSMAEAVELALSNRKPLIVEAGTGVGKTFAYLVPAFLSPDKVIISTGTKNLQAQLFEQDIPIIKQALNSQKKVFLLKGRSNYLCLYRLEQTLHAGRFAAKQMAHDLMNIEAWSHRTRLGDIAELESISEDAMIWSHVTSHHDNCLGSDCPNFEKCHVMYARRKAQSADILIVNHHLFLADLLLKTQNIDDLLPKATHVIFDEAHQVPETATHFFGLMVSSRQIMQLVEDMQQEYLTTSRDVHLLQEMAEQLQTAIQACRLALGEHTSRCMWEEVASKMVMLDELIDLLEHSVELLGSIAGHSKGLENCWQRAQVMTAQLKQFKNSHDTTMEQTIRWVETFSKSFVLHVTPLDVSALFVAAMQCYPGAWIFTSATLAVADDFRYFSKQLGLNTAQSLKLTSPFQYDRQVIAYIPLKLPVPSTPNYTQLITEAIIPILEISRGRTFFLFTSFRALETAHAILSNRIDYPLLVQGSKPKYKLLNDFRKLGNAVLLGTHSFWEGVDVRGEALSCVIIDKLPFTAPDEPVLKAHIDLLRRQGKDPFQEYQLPSAAISLKQGVGRLIRDEKDFGIIVLCDPRLFTARYGKVFLDSLPKMRYTRCLKDVKHFFEEKCNEMSGT